MQKKQSEFCAKKIFAISVKQTKHLQHASRFVSTKREQRFFFFYKEALSFSCYFFSQKLKLGFLLNNKKSKNFGVKFLILCQTQLYFCLSKLLRSLRLCSQTHNCLEVWNQKSQKPNACRLQKSFS